MPMFNSAPIHSTGGWHIPNYLRNSNAPNIPAPIQAGKIYGPVGQQPGQPFGPSKPAVVTIRPANVKNLPSLNSYASRTPAGYSFPK